MIKKVILVLSLTSSIYLNAISFSNLENKFIGIDLSIDANNIFFGFDIDRKSHLDNYVVWGDYIASIGSNY